MEDCVGVWSVSERGSGINLRRVDQVRKKWVRARWRGKKEEYVLMWSVLERGDGNVDQVRKK